MKCLFGVNMAHHKDKTCINCSKQGGKLVPQNKIRQCDRQASIDNKHYYCTNIFASFAT